MTSAAMAAAPAPFVFDSIAYGGAMNAPPSFIPGTSHFLYTRNFIQQNGPCELVRRDAATGAEVAVFPGILRFGGISPDGATFSGRSQQDTGIFDAATGQIRTRLTTFTRSLNRRTAPTVRTC